MPNIEKVNVFKRPSEDFMQAWRSLSAEAGSKPTERTGSSEQARDNPLGVSGVIPADDDT